MATTHTTISASRQFRFTAPVCPTCGATLRMRITAIALQADGSYAADEVSVECEGLVPEDNDRFDSWSVAHSAHSKQLAAIHAQLLRWVNAQYRFTPTTPVTPLP